MKGHPMSIWQAMWGFDGRISRKYYWLATLILTIGHAIIFFPLLHWLVGGWWLDKRPHELLEAEKVFNMAWLIPLVLLLYPSLTISIKRLHDLNLSGWWCLPGFASNFILLAPLIGLGGWQSPTLLFQVLAWGTEPVRLVWLIVLGFIRGTAGPNRYGPKG
jgi:uncharacterized membrane protein YhaH (DUF805 family)